MPSVTQAAPSSDSKSVSSTSVPLRYRRAEAMTPPAGVVIHEPFSQVTTSAAKHAGESKVYTSEDSKRGRHEPCLCGGDRKWKHCHGSDQPQRESSHVDDAATDRSQLHAGGNRPVATDGEEH